MMPPKERALRLYEDLSQAYVLGRRLRQRPRARQGRRAAHAHEPLTNCGIRIPQGQPARTSLVWSLPFAGWHRQTRLTVLIRPRLTFRDPTGKRVCPCHPRLSFSKLNRYAASEVQLPESLDAVVLDGAVGVPAHRRGLENRPAVVGADRQQADPLGGESSSQFTFYQPGPVGRQRHRGFVGEAEIVDSLDEGIVRAGKLELHGHQPLEQGHPASSRRDRRRPRASGTPA